MDIISINQHLTQIEQQLSLLIKKEDIDNMNDIVNTIEKKMLEEDFYNDHQLVKQQTDILSLNNNLLKAYKEIAELINTGKEFHELLKEEYDENLKKELADLVNDLIKKYSDFEIKLLLDEEYDKNDCFVEIHCGAGGLESQDWVEMLYKMYVAYAKKHSFKIELIHLHDAKDAGFKSVTIKLSGLYAYGLLKNEKGVHRLIRISPFDSSSKRHTTFALVTTTPVLDEVDEVEIDSKDIEIETFKSSGAGGQSVNTTDSAVRIVHKPTKIVVTCQNQRSQIKNRQEALQMLKSKLIANEYEEKQKKLRELRGEVIDVNFGSQIRTYVFHPYAMVKDHRSNYESSNPSEVLNGKLDEIIDSVLKVFKGR